MTSSNSNIPPPLERPPYVRIPIDSSNSPPQIETPPTPVKESSSNEGTIGQRSNRTSR